MERAVSANSTAVLLIVANANDVPRCAHSNQEVLRICEKPNGAMAHLTKSAATNIVPKSSTLRGRMAFTKDLILQEIRRTANDNGGRPLGAKRFKEETGIRYQDWFGRYWKSWGDAVTEAGLVPNTLQGRLSDEFVLTSYSRLTRELRRIPVKGDFRIKKRADPGFPNEKVFDRFDSKRTLLARARKFWLANAEWSDLLDYVPILPEESGQAAHSLATTPLIAGFVYLLRSGKYYKIGHTNSVGRRTYELAIQLPEDVKVIHSIQTDDPEGIERYWHHRFASKRARGEWFNLSHEDVRAFQRRTSQ